MRGLVKSRVEFEGISLAASPLANSLAGFAREGIWRLCRSPSHESRQLRRLRMTKMRMIKRDDKMLMKKCENDKIRYSDKGKISYIIIWQSKSERSDWSFLGRDFAIRTVSVETVISCVFFVFESRKFKTSMARMPRPRPRPRANIPQYGPRARLVRGLYFR